MSLTTYTKINYFDQLELSLTPMRTGVRRVAVADTKIVGKAIRAGEGAITLLSVANQDTRVFADPDTFDIRRGPRQHFAFGFGVHQCIGQRLGRAELRVALVQLVRRFPNLALAVPVAELEVRDESVVFGIKRIPVTW